MYVFGCECLCVYLCVFVCVRVRVIVCVCVIGRVAEFVIVRVWLCAGV